MESPLYPGAEHEHGVIKQYVSPKGFSVDWVQLDELCITDSPGIYIKFSMTDNLIQEKYYFPFGEEDKAEKKYAELVRKAAMWDSVQVNYQKPPRVRMNF